MLTEVSHIISERFWAFPDTPVVSLSSLSSNSKDQIYFFLLFFSHEK